MSFENDRLPTTRDIAAKAGCSHVTVSRALRHQPNVSPALRAKIQKIADELGYRPNPLVSSLLATQNRQSKKTPLYAIIGWINAHTDRDFWHIHDYIKGYYEGAAQRAKESGFVLDEIWVGEPGMNAGRFEKILEARGIHGLILPPIAGPLPKWTVNWAERAVACIGYGVQGLPDWNRTTLAQREAVETALTAMVKKGYRRVGFAIALESHPERRSATLSGFYRVRAEEPLMGSVPPLEYHRHRENFEEPIKDWLQAHQPDAILTNDIALGHVCEAIGLRIPDDIGIAHLNLRPDVPGWAGIDVHQERQGACAVDLTASQLYRNERGVPPYSKILQVHGTWRDGYTLPARGGNSEHSTSNA